MNKDSKTTSFGEALSLGLNQFLDKLFKISGDYQVQFEADRSQIFDGILSYLMPEAENEPINNESLSNFLQSTLNNQTEKKLKKHYCTKEITRVSGNSKLFGGFTPPSIIQSHLRASLLDHNSLQIPRSPFYPTGFSAFHQIMPMKNLKEEVIQAEINQSDSGSLYQSKNSETKKNYKLYPSKIKGQIIQYAERYGTKQASEKFNIAMAKINHWTRSQKRVKQARGRKPVDPEMEERVCQWLKGELDKGVVLTQKIIRLKAKNISSSDDFKASKGWLEKFFKRRPQLFEAYSENRKISAEKQDLEEDSNQSEIKQAKKEQYFQQEPVIKLQQLFQMHKSEQSE